MGMFSWLFKKSESPEEPVKKSTQKEKLFKGKKSIFHINTNHAGAECPWCKEGKLVSRTGKYGYFLGCSRFPACKYTEDNQENGKYYRCKPGHYEGCACPKCGSGKLRLKRGKKGLFLLCTDYPSCSYIEPYHKKS